jgi:hypothetical protein
VKKEIKYKGTTYTLDKDYWKGIMLNDSIDFQYLQLEYCLEVGDFTTFENRVSNQLIWGGILIKE